MLDALLLARDVDASVDTNACQCRYDVVGGARARNSRRDRRALLGIAERRDPGDELRRGDERVDPLLRFETGVRSLAVHHDLERAGALACGLQRTAVGARFHHQHRAAGEGTLFDQRSRRLRSDLLVGGDQQLDPVEIVEQQQRVDGQHDAALHVEHSRARGSAGVDRERPGRQGSQGEDGVVVTHDQHLRRRPEPRVHVRAGVAVDQLGVATEPALDHIADGARRSCDGVDVVRRRLDRHEVFEIRQHRVE